MSTDENATPLECTGKCLPTDMAMTQAVSSGEVSNQTSSGVGPVVGLREAAEHFGMSKHTLRDWVNSGKIPGYRLGQRWRVRISDIEALLVPSGTL